MTTKGPLKRAVAGAKRKARVRDTIHRKPPHPARTKAEETTTHHRQDRTEQTDRQTGKETKVVKDPIPIPPSPIPISPSPIPSIIISQSIVSRHISHFSTPRLTPALAFNLAFVSFVFLLSISEMDTHLHWSKVYFVCEHKRNKQPCVMSIMPCPTIAHWATQTLHFRAM